MRTAIFSVNFDDTLMFEAEAIEQDFNGSWLDGMRYLIEIEGLHGLFDSSNFKLISVVENKQPPGTARADSVIPDNS